MTVTTAFTVLAVVVGTLYCAEAYLGKNKDSREPPIIRPRFPVFGHVYGFVAGGNSYHGKMKVNPAYLMYTLKIFSLKLYVLNGMDLIGAIQRAAKSVSFRPLEKLTLERFSEVNKDILDLCDTGGDFEGDGTFIRKIESGMHKALSPGPDLDRMNMETAVEIVKCLDLLADLTLSRTVDLYDWTKQTITIASTRGAYGPQNPYQSSEARKLFWDFERESGPILLGLSRLVPKGHKAAKKLIPFFEEYFNNRGYEQASALIQARAAGLNSYDFTTNEKARLEWPIALAILSNTVPVCFWTLYEIITRPDLLEEARTSLAAAVSTTTGEDSQKHHTLDLFKLKSACPILLATFQETQRFRSRSASIRKVMADTVIEQKYLLKKGSYLHIPAEPIHYNPGIWGADAGIFDPHRLLNRADKLKNTSLLAWGMAPHICPARQFATTEVLILVALVIMRFDVLPVNGKTWEYLGINTGTIATLPPPKKELQVFFREREEWTGVWKVDVGQSSSKFALVSG